MQLRSIVGMLAGKSRCAQMLTAMMIVAMTATLALAQYRAIPNYVGLEPGCSSATTSTIICQGSRQFRRE
jgi:hypothetical protein